MVELWVQFTILTAAVYAFISLLDKIVSDTELPNPQAAMALNGFPRFLTFMIIGAVGGNLFLTSVNDLWARRIIVWVGVGAGALYALAMIAWYRGIAETDVSTFVPLFATRTIFTTAFAFAFLGQSFPGVVYVAIAIIVAGAILISIENPTDGIAGEVVKSREAVVLSLLTAGLFAVIYTVLGGLTAQADVWSVLFWIGVGGFVVSLDFGLLRREHLIEIGPRSQGALIANGGLSAIAFFTFTLAVNAGPVSLVTAIVNLDAVIVFVGAVILTQIFPEVIDESTDLVTVTQKAVATSLIIGGGIIIELFA